MAPARALIGSATRVGLLASGITTLAMLELVLFLPGCQAQSRSNFPGDVAPGAGLPPPVNGGPPPVHVHIPRPVLPAPQLPPPPSQDPPAVFFPPQSHAFTPPVVVPTDVTAGYVGNRSTSKAGSALPPGLFILTEQAFPQDDELAGPTNGILVRAKVDTQFAKVGDYAVNLSSGAVLVSVRRPSHLAQVSTPSGQVALAANGDVMVSFEADTLRVFNLDGRGQSVKVKVNIPGPAGIHSKVFGLAAGRELIASRHLLKRFDLRPSDGIARRQPRLLEKGYIAVSEFSLESVLKNSELICDLRQNISSTKEKRILGDMSKMAAVLNQINGTLGFETTASALSGR